MRRVSLLFVITVFLSAGTGRAQEPACGVAVRLVVAGEGSAPAGATVRVTGVDGSVHTAVLASETDRVVLGSLPCGAAMVEVGAPRGLPEPGFDRWSAAGVELLTAGPVEVVLRVPRLYPVEIRVGTRMRPVTCGEVQVRPLSPAESGSFRIRHLGTPGPNGVVRTFLPSGTYYVLWHRLPGPRDFPGRWADVWAQSQTNLVVDDAPASLSMHGSICNEIRGRIVDPEGDGIGLVDLFAERLSEPVVMGQARSGSDGSFLLGAGELPARVTPVHREKSLRFEPPFVEVTEERRDIVFVARPSGKPELHGRTVDAETGEPIAEVSVVVRLDCSETPPTDELAYADIAPTRTRSSSAGR